ncbi:carbohydrate kinase family protein [Propionibacteriaceae bacterium Y1923]|uniref:carbohydrate kinase family protein n=1 Tax=Aestuariimicrobium sp. Y1814 TaxID=3418742 RepID=UPI003C245FE7
MNTMLCLGEALIDVVHSPDGSVVEHVGGSPLNVAGGLTRLDHPTTLACWIAEDDHGDLIRQWLADHVVALAPGSEAAPRTSVAQATVDEQGQATYEFDLVWDLPPVDVAGATHVHTGSIAAVLAPGADKVFEVLQRAAALGATISYDPNMRPALMGSPALVRDRVEAIIAISDLVKASDQDVAWLYPDEPLGQVLLRWKALGAGLVVMTQGVKGAVFVHGDDIVPVPPLRVEVADTVGAGDSFMAGLVSGLLDVGLLGAGRGRLAVDGQHQGIPEALVRAVATASITVARPGAYAPTRDEIGADPR